MRTSENLEASKELERKLDTVIEWVEKNPGKLTHKAVDDARKMRAWQKSYWYENRRALACLKQAKLYERRVDDVITEHFSKQQKLF